MILGSDFNLKAKSILKRMYIDSDGEEGVRVSVKEISEELGIDKTEARNLFEYLESKKCLKIETLGGEYLYGHVSLTKKGLARSQK
ncbi:hypothetical protein A8B79_14795 [Balneola sp. EhC07]|nr:hypothetical protein A8B79_14795 [Balneola sp. EhC07]